MRLFIAMVAAALAGPAGAACAPKNFAGVASYYARGDGMSGSVTATGERFDDRKLTAAHRCLPFGTRLVVSYRGRSVVVRINDRGPYVAGRVLDLSRGAAAAIGMLSAGTGRVEAAVILE